jgi:hypothetical protein
MRTVTNQYRSIRFYFTTLDCSIKTTALETEQLGDAMLLLLLLLLLLLPLQVLDACILHVPLTDVTRESPFGRVTRHRVTNGFHRINAGSSNQSEGNTRQLQCSNITSCAGDEVFEQTN